MSRKQPKKRKMRGRHTGRLELHGGTYIGRWMIGGRRYSRSTGIKVADFATPEAARAAADEWLQNYLRHVQAVDAVKDAKLKEATLRGAIATITAGAMSEIRNETDKADAGADLLIDTAFAAYVQSPRRKSVKDSTLRVNRSMFAQFKKWTNETHPEITLMREVTPFVAEEFARHIRKTVQAERYNAYLTTFAHVWNVLEREIRADANPWTGENLPKQERVQSLRRPLTDDELRRTFAACAADRDLTLLCSLMLFTGARLSDACLMKWESIDFTRGIVRYTSLKTNSTCKPPLQAHLRALLAETPEHERSGYIVPTFAELYQSKDGSAKCSQVIITLLKSAGIETSVQTGEGSRRRPAVTAHSFRHSFVSRCANAGVPLEICATWVGHLDETTTRRYFHDDERATLLYSQNLLTATPSPLALSNAAGDAQTIEGEIIQPSAHDAAEARFRRFCDALDGMTAEELERAADEIERRRRGA